MGVLLGICDGFLLGFTLGEKNDNQEGFLNGDYVESLLSVFLEIIIGISVSKADDDKVRC